MIDTELLGQMAQGLSQGEYFLLLGAGSSVDAIGGNGNPLPTGQGLVDALITRFGIDTGGDTLSLAQVYRYVQIEHRADTDEFLRKWFTNCIPSWQPILAEFNWKRVWTLNIDDIIENSYRQSGRPFESLAWNERFSTGDTKSGHQIIHLHGMAQHIDDGKADHGAMVFSLAEYAHELANPRTWHKVFHDEFASEPFLVIGAQLTEEVDLAAILDRGSSARASTGFPSVVVLPSVSPVRRAQLENAGFVIVESDGESFSRQLLAQYRRAISGPGAATGGNSPGIMKFRQQFIDLRNYAPHGLNAEDFYSGYQPTWKSIRSEDDAMLEKTKQASKAIVDLATSEHIYQKIVLITGNPGSGKSTALLRTASELIRGGTLPMLFRADEYMDVEATVEWLKAFPRTVLLLDDFADHSITLQNLAENCRDEGVRMLLVVADRSARHPMIRDLIEERYLNFSEALWYGKLSDDDIESVIKKLHERGRLGRITRWGFEEQRRYFAEVSERSLFEAMADLESGLGFRRRISRLYQDLPTDNLKSLYAAACMCYDQSIPLPAGIGASFAGVAPKDLVDLMNSECRGILVLTRNGIRPPHRVTASLALRTLPSKVREEVSLNLAKVLSPHIDRRSMRSGTREYRIVRHLMHHETVRRNCVDVDAARNWYETVRKYYDWNGRYWDQRALFESAQGEHETARSYAERSILVHRHSFGYNTLGTVQLRMAIRHGSVDVLSDGIENLAMTKGFGDWGEREHPFTTFFVSLIRYAQEWGFPQVPQSARDDWAQWFREAQSSPVFSNPDGQDRLRSWQRQWLQLAYAPVPQRDPNLRE